MQKKTSWIIAILLLVVLGLEPLYLLFHFKQSPSREDIFSKIIEILSTPISVGLMAFILNLVIAVIPLNNTTYANRFKRILPFSISAVAVLMIVSLYQIAWLEATTNEPVSPVHLF